MAKRNKDGLTKYDRYRLKDVEGYRKRKREWAKTQEQRRKRTEYMRTWREKNRARHNELAQKSHSKNKNKPENILYRRNYNLKKYGLTVADYDNFLATQKGKCAICSTEKPARNRFHVDHDHKTGRVRKLLCSRCNGALGWFEKYTNEITGYIQ